MSFPARKHLQQNGEGQPKAAASKPPGPRWSGRNTYSAFVQLLKFSLPVVAILLIGLMVFWQQIVPNPKFLLPDVGELSPEMARNLTMTKPRFDGLDDQGRPYTVTAETALQADGSGDIVDLSQPKADMTMDNGTWMALSADQGRYNRAEEMLYLDGQVNLFQDRGFELRTPSATIDFRSGIANGDQGIEGQGPSGQLSAEGFEVRNRGGIIIFTGKSHLTVLPDSSESGAGGRGGNDG